MNVLMKVGMGWSLLVLVAGLAACGDVTIVDSQTTPIRPDLAQAQGALTVNCESGVPVRSEQVWAEILSDGQPLLQRYRRNPDAPFRYYGDEKETTARKEVDKLLSWIGQECPETANRIRGAIASPRTARDS